MKRMILISLVGAVALPAASAQGAIVVNKSIGGLKPGMTRNQAKAVLVQPPKVSTVSNEITGTDLVYTWQGISATFAGKGNNLSYVSTTLPTERTSTGVGVGTTLAKAKAGLTGEKCETGGGVTTCNIGQFTIGKIVTTFFFKKGVVNRVSVGRVID